MFDHLIHHALRNVWCSPRQDLQVIFSPMRISKPGGALSSAGHLWSRLSMPTANGYYHLYQIGQLAPRLVGLLPDRKGWVRFSEVMGEENLIADLYVHSGLQMPRGTSYYRFTEEKNLILAVLDQPQIADLRDQRLYLRLYSNAYFASDRADDFTHRIVCRHQTMATVAEGLAFQHLYQQHRVMRGHTWLYVNGAYVDNFIPQETPLGAVLEFVYDSTVKSVLDFPIAQCPTFDSILDEKRKYLLHHSGSQVEGPVIDYRDDIDVYLIRRHQRGSNANAWEGVYYHKNQNDALRMVTHRDYAITVPYVVQHQQQRPGWTDVHALTARLVVRHSGWHRPLVNEHHRIQELYKLPPAMVGQAMHGVQATVPVWQAAHLENSYYAKIMDAYGTQVNAQMVQGAYGYNAVAKIVADTPQLVQTLNGRRQVSLPVGLHENSTVYEFDADGYLLGYYYHTKGAEYTPFHVDCALIEAIVGRGRPEIPAHYNEQISAINPLFNHRFYMADRASGEVIHSTWRDVTGDESKYNVAGSQVGWSIDMGTHATVVVSDEDFLADRFTLSPNNGLLRFSVGGSSYLYNIPPGKLDLWMNGRALIEDIDYHVAWPQVVIVNKEFLVPGDAQEIAVRATGFCQSDMTREPPAEVGFVKNGQLSRNGYFNLRGDKVVRILIKGATYERSELSFVEDGSDIRMPESMNGYPYQIENVVVPLRELVDGEDTYSYRQKSLVVDQQVADYLNQRLPEPVAPNPNMSLERYMVYSPFSSTIIHDLVNGMISMDQFQGHYSDRDVIDRLASYRYLLDYDPTQRNYDDRFMVVHPHNLMTEIRLTIYQYNFVARAVRVFLEDRVDLSRFLVIQ